MEGTFDSKAYLEKLQAEITARATQTKGKFYIKINGKLLKDDYASRTLNGYESDIRKKLISHFKSEAEILVCINAQEIINNSPMTKKQLGCCEYTELTLKKIETSTGIKPQVVITNINMTEMYDMIFTFESKFQKKGYKVREQYTKKGYPELINTRFLLSENGFGDDDHIPITKKIVFITGLGEHSGKLTTALGQIYRDHEIGLESSFSILETFPIKDLPIENEINQARAEKKQKNLIQESDGKTIDETLEKNYELLKKILKTVVNKDNLISGFKNPSDMCL
ncbi:MAG: DUF1846 family protein [candidate division SR1 bacterium]|nr:DUF1846 family protein [candidate division SR1 bacterium]